VHHSTPRTQVLALARELGTLRPRDLSSRGIPPVYLYRLHEQGELERVSRGLYILPGTGPTEHNSLAEVCKRVPNGVICLLSALRFHSLGTQSPWDVWLAIHPKASIPTFDYPPLRVVRFSGPALLEGIEEHRVEEGLLRVYNPAKTVVDCFRYRNKIGLDVALEALRDYWRDRRGTMDDLWRYARLLRVSTVMRPYLESLVA
jgi:predicted transcriptional regulator of viral defense system